MIDNILLGVVTMLFTFGILDNMKTNRKLRAMADHLKDTLADVERKEGQL